MATRTKKSPKRNRKGWHGKPRGGKTYAEHRGRELKIQELQSSNAQIETEIAAYEAEIEKIKQLQSFTSWWYSGLASKRRVKRLSEP